MAAVDYFLLPLPEQHLLQSNLTRIGMSANGAREFTAGQPVTKQEDRDTLVKMLSAMMKKGFPIDHF